MIDLTSETELTRLHAAIQTSRDALDPFRRVRNEFVKDHAGSWYSTNGARQQTYVNKMNQTANIMTFALAANNPRFKMTATDPKLRPFAYHFQNNLNKLVANINLDLTLQLTVLDAFFCMGTVKVRMAEGADAVQLEDDIWVDPGRPWVDRISLDDLILDLSARDLTKMRFMGDRYRCAFWKLKERDDFDQKVVKTLSPNSKYIYDTGTDYANMIANGQATDDDELEPMIWLEDVYLPENKQWITFAANPGQGSAKPLKVVDWDGSPRGPYKFLSLGFVPDNTVPSAPAQNLKGLHDTYNALIRKLINQARRAKRLVLFPYGDSKEADNARTAKDGDWVPSKDPKSIQEAGIGSVDGNVNAFLMAVDEVYNAQAGNIRTLGGLGQEAGTATQEEMIQQHATGVIGRMAINVLKFVGEIGEELKNLMWDDQTLEQDTHVQVGNTDQMVESNWKPDYRKGERDNYSVKVEPYSLMYRTPQQKSGQIMQTLQQIAPLWPMFQAAGASLDAERLLHILADSMDLPEIEQIVTFGQQQPGSQEGESHDATQAAQTQRTVVRKNVPSGGGAGNRQAMLAQMMQGRGPANSQQMASAGRN